MLFCFAIACKYRACQTTPRLVKAKRVVYEDQIDNAAGAHWAAPEGSSGGDLDSEGDTLDSDAAPTTAESLAAGSVCSSPRGAPGAPLAPLALCGREQYSSNRATAMTAARDNMKDRQPRTKFFD